jgi:hypothetical protein
VIGTLETPDGPRRVAVGRLCDDLGRQLAYVLDGIDWRNPQRIWRPQVVG